MGERSEGSETGEQVAGGRVLGATGAVAAAMLGVALLSFVQELVVASTFGVGPSVVAFVVPTFMVNVVADSFTPALLPTWVRVRASQGADAARRLFSSVMLVATGFMVIAAVLTALLSSHFVGLIGGDFDQETRSLSALLLVVLSTVVPLAGLAAIWRAILNASGRFAVPTASRAAVPFAATTIVLIGSQSLGIRSLAIGVVCGFALQIAILAPAIRRIGLPVIGHSWRAGGQGRTVFRQYTPMAAGASMMSATVLVDDAMASRLGAGSVSALHYGQRASLFLLGVGATAVGTVLLPHFSRLAAADDWDGVRHLVRRAISAVLLVSVPVSVALALTSEEIVRIAFERGEFDAAATSVVGEVQAMYLLQVPPYLTGIVLARLLAALLATRVLLWGAVISFFSNIGLNLVLSHYLGVSGIALSTAVVMLVSALFLGFMASRLMAETTR